MDQQYGAEVVKASGGRWYKLGQSWLEPAYHAGRAIAMRWFVTFVAPNGALLAFVLAMLWAVGSFEDAGLSAHGWIALFLDIILTSALGVGLMALVFHSARKDYDDNAHRTGRLDR